MAENVRWLLHLRLRGYTRRSRGADFVHDTDRRGGLVVIVITGEDICCAAEEMMVNVVVRSVAEIDDVLGAVDVSILVLITGLEVNAKDLHASCKSLVTAFLLTPPLKLFMVPTLYVHRHSSYLGRVHVIQAIVLHGFIIEPGAVACFPFQAADHTELGAASTCHVVASFFQLNRGGTVEAALPAFLFSDLGETLGGFVFGAFTTSVPFAITGAADFGPAAAAFAVFAATIGASRGI